MARSAAPTARLLRMRDYVHSSLYDPHAGYFNGADGPVLPPLPVAARRPISAMPNQAAYHRAVAARYGQRGANGAPVHGWSTPVEQFSPYLSRAIARRILEQHGNSSDPLRILEVGGGRGQLAADVLTYIGDARDDLGDVRYTVCEISPKMVLQQRRLLQPWIEAGRARVVCGNALDWLSAPLSPSEGEAGGSCASTEPVHVVACEVLDNLAHELVQVDSTGTLRQAFVSCDANFARPELRWADSVESEVMVAMDAFRMLDTARGGWLDGFRSAVERALTAGSADYWVPVDALRLLSGLATGLNLRSVTLLDFDHLPGALPGKNGPVVQRVGPHGPALEYPNVLDAPFGRCDIMFPTDFSNGGLENAFWAVQPRGRAGRSAVSTQQQFFSTFAARGDVAASTCLDGYNPILSEFANASVLTAEVTCA